MQTVRSALGQSTAFFTRSVPAPGRLSFVQRFLPVAKQRRQKIAQDRPRSCLDFHRCRHAGRQIDDTVIDPHLHTVERNARGVVELLALRLTRLVRRSCFAIVMAVLLTIADDGILRNVKHLAMQKAVTGEIEGVDLDLGVLTSPTR